MAVTRRSISFSMAEYRRPEVRLADARGEELATTRDLKRGGDGIGEQQGSYTSGILPSQALKAFSGKAFSAQGNDG